MKDEAELLSGIPENDTIVRATNDSMDHIH